VPDNELIEKAREKSRYYLRKRGVGSRTSVFNAIYDLVETDMPREMLPIADGMLQGFFGGVAQMGGPCGALSGSLAALGLVCGGRCYGENAPGWWIGALNGHLGCLLHDAGVLTRGGGEGVPGHDERRCYL
jgi:hypothetical protein